MKRFFTAALLLIAVVGFSQGLVEFQEGARKKAVSGLTPMPTAEDSNTGFLETMATDSVTVTSATAVKVPQLAPNTVQFVMIASGADVFFGPSDVAPGTDDFIPNGYARRWSCTATTTPNVWFITASDTATVKIRCIGRGDL